LASHVARKGNIKMQEKHFSRNLKERDHLKNLDLGKIIILKWIFKKCEMMEVSNEFLLTG